MFEKADTSEFHLSLISLLSLIHTMIDKWKELDEAFTQGGLHIQKTTLWAPTNTINIKRFKKSE